MFRRKKIVVSQDVVHPVYLDASMMIDFLAGFDDGVSFSSDVARRIDTGRKRASELGGSAGIADLMGMNLAGNGRLSRESTHAESTESKFVRQHTLASLFNRLRQILDEKGRITRLEKGELTSLVRPGALVEVEGTIDRNPLDALSQLYDDFRPYAVTQQRQESRRGMNEETFEDVEEFEDAVREDAERKYRDMDEMFGVVKADLEKGQIIDLPMAVDGGLSILVAANREFYTPQVEAAMLGGTFKVLGKVSGIRIAEGEDLAIVRRGAIGLIGEDRLQLLVDSMKNSEIEIRVPPLTISPPWVQIIPLSIYV